VFIKILYLLLVLCMGALIGAVIAGYLRIRRQMKQSSKPPKNTTEELEHENRP